VDDALAEPFDRADDTDRGSGSWVDRSVRIGVGVAGPASIVVAVLIALWATAFQGLLSIDHVDPLSMWLPTHCFLGESLRAGTVPAWNPSLFTGVPFVADPQSGWMFLLPMLLYTTMSCAAAAPTVLVLTPIIGGLGMYAFLRSETLSRPPATLGGLVLSLALIGSRLGQSLPFTSTLAWLSVMLWAASRLLRATTLSSKLAWVGVTAVLWGQVVAAHATQGQMLGSGILVAFLIARCAGDLRAGRRALRPTLALGSLLLLAMITLNAAILVPRALALPRATPSIGNRTLDQIARTVGNRENDLPYVEGGGTDPLWPMKLALWQGAFVGMIPLALATASPWSRRHRALGLGVAVFGGATYLLSLQVVATWIAETFGRPRWLDALYLHQPWRFAIGVIPAIAVLAAVGLDALRDRGWVARLAMLVPGIVVWGLAPALGTAESRLAFPSLIALVVAVTVLVAVDRVPVMATIVVVVVGVTLVGNALAGHGLEPSQVLQSRAVGFGRLPPGMRALTQPTVDVGEYLAPTPIAHFLRSRAPDARYAVAGSYHKRGMLRRRSWGALAENRAAPFDLEDVGGYNPFQLSRYWLFARRASDVPQKYNLTSFPDVPSRALDILGVAYVIADRRFDPLAGWQPRVRDGRWILYARSHPPLRAEAFRRWVVAGSPGRALQMVTDPQSDPMRTVVLEEDPGIRPSSSSVSGQAVTYRWVGTQAAEVHVRTDDATIVVIRDAYDPHWRATVDGEPAEVLAANYVSLGVVVPRGDHVIHLAYVDPSIGLSFAGSIVAAAALWGAAFIARRRERRATDRTDDEAEVS